MQSQDSKHIPDRTSFEKYRDPKFRGRKSHKVTSILKNDAHHGNVSFILIICSLIHIIFNLYYVFIFFSYLPLKINDRRENYFENHQKKKKKLC